MDRIEKLKEFLRLILMIPLQNMPWPWNIWQAGDDGTARRYLEEVLERDPAAVGSYYQLGKLLERTGETDLALQWYEKGMAAARAAGEKRAYNELQTAYDDLADKKTRALSDSLKSLISRFQWTYFRLSRTLLPKSGFSPQETVSCWPSAGGWIRCVLCELMHRAWHLTFPSPIAIFSCAGPRASVTRHSYGSWVNDTGGRCMIRRFDTEMLCRVEKGIYSGRCP
jgi:tetratricopeptide (TPR) repeat protein